MNLTNTLVLGDAVVGEVQLPDGRQAYSITSKHSRAVSSDYGTGLATTIFSETMLIDPSTRRLLQRRNLYETTCATEGPCGTNTDTTTTYSDYNVPVTIEFPEPEPTDRPPPPTATPTPPSANQ